MSEKNSLVAICESHIQAEGAVHERRGECNGLRPATNQRLRSIPIRTQHSIPLKTRGEIEAAISEEISRFEQAYMGRGPKDIHTHLLGDLLVVRLQCVLTAAEQHLVKSLLAEKGRNLLKEVRTHLIETARPVLEAMVEKVTGVKVVTMHHDISTVTGEKVVLFTLTRSPDFREAEKKRPFQAGGRWPSKESTRRSLIAEGVG